MTKTAIILHRVNGGRLANQLWNLISIYSYCQTLGYHFEPFGFFPYHQYFDLPAPTSLIAKVFFNSYKNFGPIKKAYLYQKYLQLLLKLNLPNLISDHDETFYLSKLGEDNKLLDYSNIYFYGWRFRNPRGIKKYHQEIIKVFQPNRSIQNKIDAYIKPIRQQFSNVIGVHIRQTDYRTYADGQYYFSPSQVRKILTDYILFSKLPIEKTAFVICSEPTENVTPKMFFGLNAFCPGSDEAVDLFTLAATDLIIGSNSTYGAFAAYYGNIPIVVFNQKMNWSMASNRSYNYKNDCTTVHY